VAAKGNFYDVNKKGDGDGDEEQQQCHQVASPKRSFIFLVGFSCLCFA